MRPDTAFGADLIAGFPTETEAMFENTLALVEEAGLAFLHVFPFSPRPGTPAARMPQVARAVVKDRAARLRAAGEAALARHLDAPGRPHACRPWSSGRAWPAPRTSPRSPSTARRAVGEIVGAARSPATTAGARWRDARCWRRRNEPAPAAASAARCASASTASSAAASICHCRMCQKAFGGFFGPLVSAKVARPDLDARRAASGSRAPTRSRRGFCGDCGTPLTFEWSGQRHRAGHRRRSTAPPQSGPSCDGRDHAMPWIADLAGLPLKQRQEDAAMQGTTPRSRRQHPDRDTDHWPPRAEGDMSCSPRAPPWPGDRDDGDGGEAVHDADRESA